MTLTDAQENPARIMFCVSRDDLYRIRVQRDELDHFIRTLLRLYNGVFTEFRQIDEGEIATWSGYTVERVKELLKRLWQLRVIRYVPSNRSPILFMNEERLPRADLYISPRHLQTASGADARTFRTHARLCRQRKPAAGAPCWKPTSARAIPRRAASATSVWPAGAPQNKNPSVRRRQCGGKPAQRGARTAGPKVPPTRANWPTDFRAACSGPAR